MKNHSSDAETDSDSQHINQLFSDALVAYIVYRWADGNQGRLLQAQCDELSRHFYIFAYNLRKLEPGRFDQTIRTLFTPLIKMALLPRYEGIFPCQPLRSSCFQRSGGFG